MKTLLLGGAFNMQFGGAAYSDKFVFLRMRQKAKMGGYFTLLNQEVAPDELVGILDELPSIATDVKEGTYDDVVTLFKGAEAETMKEDLYAFKNQYPNPVQEAYDVMPKDWFLLLRLFFLKHEELKPAADAILGGFATMLIDALSNSGRIETIHEQIPFKVKTFMGRFDQLYTVNYDQNPEHLFSKKIVHLYGTFDDLMQSETAAYDMQKAVIPDLLDELEDEVHVAGISVVRKGPLFEHLAGNEKLKKIVVYYSGEDEKQMLEAHYDKKRFRLKSAKKLWEGMEDGGKRVEKKKLNTGRLGKLLEQANQYAESYLTEDEFLREYNQFTNADITRFCRMIREEMDAAGAETAVDEHILNEVYYLALQEGVLPAVFFMISFMHYDKIR